MQFTVINNTLLTPESADKSVFYLTLQAPEGEVLCYQPGDWLTLQADNDLALVGKLLHKLGLTGDESVELRRQGVVTSLEALQCHIEITQLNPAILNKLQRQHHLGEWADRSAMMEYAQGRDILDLFTLFPSLKQWGVSFITLLSPLAPRYYSIASASEYHAQQTGVVSVLFKAVDYERDGRKRLGVTTRHLSGLSKGDKVEGELKPNQNFKLPSHPKTPIIMVGAGTGLAPFIGFMQQRIQSSESGPNVLFYGETSKATTCLFCKEFAAWKRTGLVEPFYAFSRDQAEKVYVQHLLARQKTLVWQTLQAGGHLYICGSQSPMASAVEQCIKAIFRELGGLSVAGSERLWASLKTDKRIQLDVY